MDSVYQRLTERLLKSFDAMRELGVLAHIYAHLHHEACSLTLHAYQMLFGRSGYVREDGTHLEMRVRRIDHDDVTVAFACRYGHFGTTEATVQAFLSMSCYTTLSRDSKQHATGSAAEQAHLKELQHVGLLDEMEALWREQYPMTPQKFPYWNLLWGAIEHLFCEGYELVALSEVPRSSRWKLAFVARSRNHYDVVMLLYDHGLALKSYLTGHPELVIESK